MATIRLMPWRMALLTALATFGLVACTQGDAEPTASPESTEAATPAEGAQLSAEQVFAAVSPSIAFVETPIATGSGILITEFHLVTNAHVVWPFEQVRVLFPDGSEYLDSPVIGWDLMADLAVIQLPGGGSLQPTELASGESLAVGSELYLIGYPAEGELFPQPSISRGILSRFRTWEQPGIRYIQTDASIEGGQSVVQVAEANGVSEQELTDYLLGEIEAKLDEAVESGRIDQATADEKLAGAAERIAECINREGPPEHRAGFGSFREGGRFQSGSGRFHGGFPLDESADATEAVSPTF
ncbi:MAG: trypsin-like peptidase domain-containing protein [Chloroflexi bacterium]|nr:trypsin-like peptidase domain-containing protein [Chloroflexota bacterium]